MVYAFKLCGVMETNYLCAQTITKQEKESEVSSGPAALRFAQREEVEQNQELERTKEKKQYLVLSSSEKKVEQIENQYEKVDNISNTSSNFLKKEKMTVIEMTGEEAVELQRDPCVQRVEEDYEVVACGHGHIKNRRIIKKTQNKRDNIEWNLKTIKADKVSTDSTQQKVKVAVIDSGIDMANDVLIQESINLIPGEEELLPLFYDVSGHGTSVAGIIAAKKNGKGITGINPNVELYSVRALDNNNQAPVSRVVEGIYWAIEHDVHIINMSFGLDQDSELLRKAIQDAYAKGILLVAAAGNTGANVQYPAAYPEVIAVGALNSDGTVSDESATGEEVELVAPGDCVRSTAGFETTLICSGTSMAVPHVTGVASLLWEKDLSMSSEFIRKLLCASANHYNNDEKYGYGMIDAQYAMAIYDEFKSKYRDETIETVSQEEVNEKMADNESPVVIYQENDYVKGSWLQAGHEQAVTGKGAGDLEEIKAGAVYPDKSEYLKGISDNGVFHGRGIWPEGSMEEAGNYIANTIYLYKIAQRLRKEEQKSEQDREIIPYQKAGMYLDEYSMWETFGFECIHSQLTMCEEDPNNYKKIKFRKNKWFLLGIAVHCATDAYAHSAFVCKDNKWYRVVHPKGNSEVASGDVQGKDIIGADDMHFSVGRWGCANQVATNIVHNLKKEELEDKDYPVNYKTFMVDNYIAGENAANSQMYPYQSLQFTLYKLYTYADQTEERAMDERGLLFRKTMWFWK